MTLQLTSDRLEEIKEETGRWLNKSSATLKEVQSLVGKLNFAATTVRSGHLFSSRILEFMKNWPLSGRRSLSGSMRKDIKLWNVFITEFDGISMMPEEKWEAPDKCFATDACLEGCGGWCKGEYFHAQFPRFITCNAHVYINELRVHHSSRVSSYRTVQKYRIIGHFSPKYRTNIGHFFPKYRTNMIK